MLSLSRFYRKTWRELGFTLSGVEEPPFDKLRVDCQPASWPEQGKTSPLISRNSQFETRNYFKMNPTNNNKKQDNVMHRPETLMRIRRYQERLKNRKTGKK